MTLEDLDGLFIPATGPTNAGDTQRKCSHPKRHRLPILVGEAHTARPTRSWRCLRCGHQPDPDRQRIGRNNRYRGQRKERKNIRDRLQLQHVGGLNRERDGGDRMDPFVAQHKAYARGRFPQWMLTELDHLRRPGLLPSQTPILVVEQAYGSGHKSRAIVVLEFTDWLLLHGPTPEDADD